MAGCPKAMTLTETLVVVVVVLLLLFFGIMLLLPPLGGKGSSPRLQSNTHLRGIHQSLVVHADHVNNGYFIGLTPDGDPERLSDTIFSVTYEGDAA